MKKFRIGITAGLLMLGMMAVKDTKVYAGSINGAEQQLIGYLGSATFTYKGREYKATSAALGALSSKLSEDGIDMTESQLSKAMGMIDSYVPTAAYYGYIVAVEGSDSDTDEKENTTANKTENKTEEKTEDKTENNTTKEENSTKNDATANEQSTEKKNDSNQEQGESQENSTKNNTSKKDDLTSVTVGHDKVYSTGKIDKENPVDSVLKKETKDIPTTVEQYLKGTVTVSNGETIVFDSTLPVKNTGITIHNGLLWAAMLGVIFMMAVIGSYKYIIFAKHEDE